MKGKKRKNREENGRCDKKRNEDWNVKSEKNKNIKKPGSHGCKS